MFRTEFFYVRATDYPTVSAIFECVTGSRKGLTSSSSNSLNPVCDAIKTKSYPFGLAMNIQD